MSKRRVKLFDTSGGCEIPKATRKSRKIEGDTEAYFGHSTIYGLDRGGGILNSAEAAKIPRRNRAGRVTRVPAAIVNEATSRAQDESRHRRERKSTFYCNL